MGRIFAKNIYSETMGNNFLRLMPVLRITLNLTALKNTEVTYSRNAITKLRSGILPMARGISRGSIRDSRNHTMNPPMRMDMIALRSRLTLVSLF
jgi:hypothetical protein